MFSNGGKDGNTGPFSWQTVAERIGVDKQMCTWSSGIQLKIFGGKHDQSLPKCEGLGVLWITQQEHSKTGDTRPLFRHECLLDFYQVEYFFKLFSRGPQWWKLDKNGLVGSAITSLSCTSGVRNSKRRLHLGILCSAKKTNISLLEKDGFARCRPRVWIPLLRKTNLTTPRCFLRIFYTHLSSYFSPLCTSIE